MLTFGLLWTGLLPHGSGGEGEGGTNTVLPHLGGDQEGSLGLVWSNAVLIGQHTFILQFLQREREKERRDNPQECLSCEHTPQTL